MKFALYSDLHLEPDLFESDFKISKQLGIHTKGREKECDFVIYSPTNKAPRFLIEVKRTSFNHDNLRPDVHQDLARMAICSKELLCYCYVLVCGEKDYILSALSAGGALDFSDQSKNNTVNTAGLDISDEYRLLIKKFGCENIFSRFQGCGGNDSNSVYMWQISTDASRLESQKPYAFQIIEA